jgi:hypothetical protein
MGSPSNRADGSLSTRSNPDAASDLTEAFTNAIEAKERSRSREAHRRTIARSRSRESIDAERHICVDLPSGNSVNMWIKDTDAHDEIKEAIYSLVGIPPATYELFAATEGMDSFRMLCECERYVAFVGGSGDAAASGAFVARSCRNTSLQAAIERVIAAGRVHPRYRDCKGVKLGAMQIFVTSMLAGLGIVEVMPGYTVADVKAKIQVTFAFDAGCYVPVEIQRLYYVSQRSGAREDLQLENATLRDYGIQHGDTLELRCREEESVPTEKQNGQPEWG